MRPVCWGCCGLLLLLIAAIAAFRVWTIAATNPVWKAEDVVVAKYAEEHPNQTNNDFGRFAYNALHKAWPCKE
jgi:hypothetical protein